jgi:hypothetical protein
METVGYAIGTLTRPADTTQYGDGDAISQYAASSDGTISAIEFKSLGSPLYGGALCHTFKLTSNDTDVVSASFRLWLYDSTPTTLSYDNAAMTNNVYEERANCIGYVDFSTMVAGSDGKIGFGTPIFTNLLGLPGVASTGSIYGLLQAKGTYTPASGEIFHILIGWAR